MNRFRAIKCILENSRDDDLIVSTTGMISREVFFAKDRVGNFYMLGSMGLASAFALGVALNSSKRIMVLDGDGSALMNMGTMANIAESRAKNLIHIILDNHSYQSTGNQPAISRAVPLEKVALACGYRKVLTPLGLSALSRVLRSLKEGPLCILVKVDKQGLPCVKRVSLAPLRIKERLVEFLNR